MQRRVHKVKMSEIKLEDIAKRAPFEIRSKYFTSEFFLECLAILKKRKFKTFKKIQWDHLKGNRLFDKLLWEA